jgi:hypothetical protein
MPGSDKNLGKGWESIFIEKLKNNRMEVVLSVTISKSGETNITVFREKEKAEKKEDDGSNKTDDKKNKDSTKEQAATKMADSLNNGKLIVPSDSPQPKIVLNATKRIAIKKVANKKVANKKVAAKK